MRKIMTWPLLISLILVVSACGGAAPTQAPTSAPVKATDAPTVAAQTGGVPELSETVTSSKNGVTVKYPKGWLKPAADVGVFLYNNADGQNFFNSFSMKPGGMAFQVNSQANSSNKTPEALFTFSFENLAKGINITLSAPEKLKIGSVEALKASGKSDRTAMYVGLLPTDDKTYPFATFVAYAHPDELAANVPLFDAMLATVSVKTP